ncbi:hypothetical protein PtA15_11A217 [Puccinia triticina]|uniref:Uncharacterized protein n=1 Tax=Puccinia triticina TaxID=208348 RepID=A0ABY7CYK9_9BASI|nr:uncharacterized protein PtA15_11A216 [Puccinia triticina]XP_053025083.1 uncharacterized protein PtA15_11A217 [Puccinia triticina]WAQ89527.1 hypothetical protein PtA15_11A216 [Puccinia triticina]WAQ89528.1 hypothetical protein PtA15_11A217 [Puccinia triticina]
MLPHQPVNEVVKLLPNSTGVRLLPNSTGVPPITPFGIFVIVIYPSDVIPTVSRYRSSQKPAIGIVLGVEHLGTLDQYLGICQIGVHDHHTRILLEHYKITHWTYFRRVHPDTLLMLKFAKGPAQQLCDGMALWVATLQKNRREIKNEVEYASNR